MRVRAFLLAAAAGLAAAPGLAQTRADGVYPGSIACDPLPFSRGPLREPITVTIANGEARYARTLSGQDGAAAAGATETGRGPLAAGQVSLSGGARGRGFSYEARYGGAVDGRGGLLVGTQTWTYRGASYRRICQITLGS